jgi:hypothetical protein
LKPNLGIVPASRSAGCGATCKHRPRCAEGGCYLNRHQDTINTNENTKQATVLL